jgi:hypothetical protein
MTGQIPLLKNSLLLLCRHTCIHAMIEERQKEECWVSKTLGKLQVLWMKI